MDSGSTIGGSNPSSPARFLYLLAFDILNLLSLIYVTGAPGVGKTTLKAELATLGYETHDMDDPDLGGAHNKVTSKRVEIPPAETRTQQWYDEHEWRTHAPAIEELKEKAQDKEIFVCGVAPDDLKVLSLFDKVVYLDLPSELLKQRISERSGNDYGRNNFELKSILERKAMLDKRYTEFGTTKVCASGSVQEVADRIKLALTQE